MLNVIREGKGAIMLMPSFKKIAAIFMLVSAGAMDAGAANVQLPPPRTLCQAASKAELNLPANTPGLEEDIVEVSQTGANIGLRIWCMHVVVKKTGLCCGGELYHLYFPVDGRQPTTEEAAVWSCANVDNREHSQITNWYMKMFGVIPHNGNFIQAGWTNPEAVRIINANSMDIDKKTAFINDFRKIASDPVGRELLYRILIEVRRYKNEGNAKKGAIGDDVPELLGRQQNNQRSNFRAITAKWSDKGSFLDQKECAIGYGNTVAKLTTVFALDSNRYSICLFETESNISLFHEMIHWFHILRNPERFLKEINAYSDGRINVAENLHVVGHYETLGSYFWGKIDNGTSDKDEWKVSATPWLTGSLAKSSKYWVSFEEIRTILGAPTEKQYRGIQAKTAALNKYYYLNGDDLSENKYRVSLGTKIRFGHDVKPFYEDSMVIYRAKDVSGAKDMHLINQNTGNSLDQKNKSNAKNFKKGLGNFRISACNLSSMVLDIVPE